ncbi:hypothetical protein ACJV1Z_01320 [Klebsiella pneumoniae]|uniref:hypothetical protein n=1 Tax=Klebsiella pneumoniae TaxID=573 RepID=UPI000DFF7990|nr:hypothetical protein [Klebsiella pneumoniae]MCA4071967.1 hypothetical protein [Klebsiella pneumoniae]STT25706.1 Uncharacterised protein [Klebsiella pneumoniae]SWX48372.1 Uncharacterised protein [Klebsiella pneumoniae]HBR6336191.1 hypothetical protein [Klebsiella pneumoniae]HBR7843890.1 hypothetical protein [Klebsiella pneumoniae]
MDQYVSLISSLIGVLGTLGGAWIANLYSEKRFTAQAVLDKSIQNTKLITSKAEDLYLLLTIWQKYVFNYQNLQVSLVKGEITKDQFYDFVSRTSVKETHDRLDTLLPIYFPELTQYMKKLRENIALGNDAFDSYDKQELSKSEAYKVVFESMMNTADSFKELKEALSAQVHEFIK